MQSLNDSVDELKTRIAKLDKTIQDLQTQLQKMQSQPPHGPRRMPGTCPADPAQRPAAPMPEASPDWRPDRRPGAPQHEPGSAAAADLSERLARLQRRASYQLAAGEFQDVLHYYPLDDLAGTAQFYLGEIAYQQKHYDEAVNAYNAVLEGFSGNAKAPAAQLHKGLALLALNKREAGIHELRLLIQRHPQTPEAAQRAQQAERHGRADYRLAISRLRSDSCRKAPLSCGAFLLR